MSQHTITHDSNLSDQTNRIEKKIPKGVTNFRELIVNHDVYVDKSLLIKDIIEDTGKTLLITHPRRWGKTLNLDMFKEFIHPKSNNSELDLFKDLNIGSSDCNVKINTVSKKISCKELQNKYPTIHFKMGSVSGDNYKDVVEEFELSIAELFGEYDYLLSSNKLNKIEKNKISRIANNEFKNESELKESLKFLANCLYEHHKENVYILIDEYDIPVHALLEQYLGTKKNEETEVLLENVSNLTSSIVCSTAKEFDHLKKLIMTGILNTIYKAISVCNNAIQYTISHPKFNQYLGFTQKDVRNLVNQLDFSNSSEILYKIENWYNGYQVPIYKNKKEMMIPVYNSYSVMRYLADVQNDEGAEPQSYCAESGSNRIIKKLLSKEKCLNSAFSNKLKSIIENEEAIIDFSPHASIADYD